MTVDELLSFVAALPGARPLPANPPLTSAAMVAGIEVTATATTSEQAMRRTWRTRRGTGATPLLLVAADPERPDSLLALGVVDATGPVRSIETNALADVVQRVSTRPRLEAVRELAAELDRLDQAGIPGLKLRELLTLHTLDDRLRGDPARWARATETTKAIGRDADWRTVLTSLGYALERRRHRGYLARSEGRPVIVVHLKADPAEFGRLDEDGRPPEGLLLNDCRSDGAPFGVLAHGSGGRLRLFEADPAQGAAVARYLDVDAGALREEDRPFLALLGPEFLAEDGFAALQADARASAPSATTSTAPTLACSPASPAGSVRSPWPATDRAGMRSAPRRR